MTADSTSRPRRLPRFSLRSLILFVTLAGSGYGLWARWEPWVRESGKLEQQETSPLWDLSTLEPIMDVNPNEEFEILKRITGETSHIFAVDKDSTVRIWNYPNRPPSQADIFLSGHTQVVEKITVSPNGKLFATTAKDGTRIWSATSGEHLRTIPDVDNPENYGIYRCFFAFRSTSPYLIQAQPTGWHLINPSTGKTHARILDRAMSHPHTLWLSESGERALAKSPNYAPTLWDVRASKRIATLSDHHFLYGPSFDIGGDLDGMFVDHGSKIIAVTENDSKSMHTPPSELATSIRIYDAEDGQIISILPIPGTGLGCLDYTPDLGRIVTVSSYLSPPSNYRRASIARIWEMDTRQEIGVLRGHQAPIILAQFTNDEKRILSVGKDHTIRFWDSHTGALLATMSLGDFKVDYFRESQDGRRLIFWSAAVGPNPFVVYRRRRPEHWWGVAWLPEFWLTVALAGALVFSLWRDSRIMRA